LTIDRVNVKIKMIIITFLKPNQGGVDVGQGPSHGSRWSTRFDLK
jgi:hypothetical protein